VTTRRRSTASGNQEQPIFSMQSASTHCCSLCIIVPSLVRNTGVGRYRDRLVSGKRSYSAFLCSRSDLFALGLLGVHQPDELVWTRTNAAKTNDTSQVRGGKVKASREHHTEHADHDHIRAPHEAKGHLISTRRRRRGIVFSRWAIGRFTNAPESVCSGTNSGPGGEK